ncbi:hypothetical protein [Fuerstiella marisgermanici]|uniref:Uncharacterized protein n=1 Tax=Fuerstiella marisgermanici TaxID=1891926 RepID=A0A1P8WJY4_9PLAN|nr:hypothetical protein [Fuerstiella marisgermanici]APZ94361.1 putative protein related to plant photosystem II stability/assembly factor [Fuerstiella marisgermanici]
MDQIAEHFTFVAGFVENRNTLQLLATSDELTEDGEANSTLMKKTLEPSARADFHLDWFAKRACVTMHPKRTVVIVSEDGRALYSSSDGMVTEQVSDEIPAPLGVVRNMRLINDEFVCVGMSRQVYRRDREQGWQREDDGALAEPSLEEVMGFNAVDGNDLNNLVAVGFGGEIWERERGVWSQAESPTNLMLNDVRLAKNSTVYACGKNGVLLSKANGAWSVIDHGTTDDELWSLEDFMGHVFVASSDAVYRLEDTTLEPINVTTKDDATFGFLHANDGVLLSVGSKHVFWSTDASKWEQIMN